MYYTDGEGVFQTPAGSDCSGDGSAAGSGPVDVVGTGGAGGYKDDSATLADLRELLNTLEDAARGARRVYGASHPFAKGFLYHIEHSRAALAARETPPPGSP